MKANHVLATSLLLAALPAMAADHPKPGVVAFNAAVRVDVDASGTPIAVEAARDLPQAIRSYIEKRVASWQYTPAKQGDVTVPATTYVQVAACAIPTPSGDAFSLAADFDGNGPRNAGDRRMQPPKYPPEAQRQGVEAEFLVVLDVAADGSARLGRIEQAEVSRQGRAGEFEQELRRWAKILRFDPEWVAGKPVPGQVRLPVSFDLPSNAEWQVMRDELQAKASASRECRMAQGGNSLRPVAVQPVVTVIPKPAG